MGDAPLRTIVFGGGSTVLGGSFKVDPGKLGNIVFIMFVLC